MSSEKGESRSRTALPGSSKSSAQNINCVSLYGTTMQNQTNFWEVSPSYFADMQRSVPRMSSPLTLQDLVNNRDNMCYHERSYQNAARTSEIHLSASLATSTDHDAADSRPGLAHVTKQRDHSPYLQDAGPRKMNEPHIQSANSEIIAVPAPDTMDAQRNHLPPPSSTGDWELSLLSPPRSPWRTSTPSLISSMLPASAVTSGASQISPSDGMSLPLYHSSSSPFANATNDNLGVVPHADSLWRDAKWLIGVLIDIVSMIAQVIQVFRPRAGA